MFQTLINIFRVPELRNKVLFTLFMLAIYRIGYHVPLPGVDQSQLEEMVNPGRKKVAQATLHVNAAQQALATNPNDPALQSALADAKTELEHAEAEARRGREDRESGAAG